MNSIPSEVKLFFDIGGEIERDSPGDKCTLLARHRLHVQPKDLGFYPMFFLGRVEISGSTLAKEFIGKIISVEYYEFERIESYRLKPTDFLVHVPGLEQNNYKGILRIPQDIRIDQSKQGWAHLIAAAIKELGVEKFDDFKLIAYRVDNVFEEVVPPLSLGNLALCLYNDDHVRFKLFRKKAEREQSHPTLPGLFAFARGLPFAFFRYEWYDTTLLAESPVPSSASSSEPTAPPSPTSKTIIL